MGYTKLFNEIVMSTVWREPDYVRIVWITMLALKDRWHIVSASLPGLADAARVSIKDCEKALKILASPDQYSRSKGFDGRRIEECDGGWAILNGEKYRNKMSQDERNEYQRLKQREYRARKKSVKTCLQNSKDFTHTDTDTEADTDTKKRKKRESAAPLSLSPLAEKWNQLSGELPKVLSSSNGRRKKEKQRLKTFSEAQMIEAIQHLAASPFCNGENDRGWKASYDFLIASDENVLKANEGRYDKAKSALERWAEE